MLEKHGGVIIFWCDGRCNTMCDSGARRIQSANRVLRANGWRIVHAFGKHYCPNCSKKIVVKLATERAEQRIPLAWEKWR